MRELSATNSYNILDWYNLNLVSSKHCLTDLTTHIHYLFQLDHAQLQLVSKAAESRTLPWQPRLHSTYSTVHISPDSTANALAVTWGPGSLESATLTNGCRLLWVDQWKSRELLRKDDRTLISGWRGIWWHSVRITCILNITRSMEITR